MRFQKGNTFGKGGQPKYKTAEELADKCGQYFEECEAQRRPMTMAGLRFFLGLASGDALTGYANRGDDFKYVVELAKLRVESYLSDLVLTRKAATGGVVFTLKNNFGWKDRIDIAQESTINGADVSEFRRDIERRILGKINAKGKGEAT